MTQVPIPTTTTTRTIRYPRWGYLHLELCVRVSLPFTVNSHPKTTTAPKALQLDILTARTCLTAALSQFLGYTGTAIPIDILKVERREVWIRVPGEDLSAVVAGAGGWIGAGDGGDGEEIGWRVRGRGRWLGALVGREGEERVWEG